MAEPLMPQEEVNPNRPQPRTVVAAKLVDIALVTYIDERGQQQTQLAVMGDSKVHLLEGRTMGFSRTQTPQGVATEWLSKGIFAKLGRKAK